jgi:hypothetical protein
VVSEPLRLSNRLDLPREFVETIGRPFAAKRHRQRAKSCFSAEPARRWEREAARAFGIAGVNPPDLRQRDAPTCLYPMRALEHRARADCVALYEGNHAFRSSLYSGKAGPSRRRRSACRGSVGRMSEIHGDVKMKLQVLIHNKSSTRFISPQSTSVGSHPTDRRT